MNERGSGKSRKSPASKAASKPSGASKVSASKAPATKAPAAKASASKTPAPKASAPKKAAKAVRRPPAEPARKRKSAAPREEAGHAAALLDAPSLMARVIRLERERDRLQTELANAEARIRSLEEGREQAINRIDWVIDTLRNLLEDEG